MSKAAPAMAPAHLPAWRKLGLKLKSEEARTPPEPDVLPTIDSTPATKKRKLSLPDSLRDHVRAAHRDKSPDVVSTPHPLAGTNGGSERRHPLDRSVSMEDPTPQTSPRKRKSVSFTPDTKVEDGGKSLRELHFATAQAQELASLFDTYITNSISSKFVDPTVNQDNAGVEKKAMKKKKKSQSHSTLLSTSSSASDPSPREDEGTSKAKTSNLRYLEEYLQDPDNWKFNKNKEVWTVKNALDVDKIPAKYDAALFVYVRGLKNPKMRLRLFQNAKEVLADDDGELTNEQKANLAKAAQLADDRASKAAQAGRYHVGMKNPGDPETPIDTAAYQHEAIVQALKSIRKRVHDEALADEEKEHRKSTEFKLKMLTRARAQQLMWAVGPEEWFRTTAAEDRQNPPKVRTVHVTRLPLPCPRTTDRPPAPARLHQPQPRRPHHRHSGGRPGGRRGQEDPPPQAPPPHRRHGRRHQLRRKRPAVRHRGGDAARHGARAAPRQQRAPGL